MIDDWAMKLVPMRFRENQSQWFGKRGLSWHFAAVIHLSDHPDCKPVDSNEYHIHIFIVGFDSCKQDWFSACGIVEEVLEAFKKSHPPVTNAHLRSGNAGCYHNAPLLSTINAISKRTGIEVTRHDFSDPQIYAIGGLFHVSNSYEILYQRTMTLKQLKMSRKVLNHHLVYAVLK